MLSELLEQSGHGEQGLAREYRRQIDDLQVRSVVDSLIHTVELESLKEAHQVELQGREAEVGAARSLIGQDSLMAQMKARSAQGKAQIDLKLAREEMAAQAADKASAVLKLKLELQEMQQRLAKVFAGHRSTEALEKSGIMEELNTKEGRKATASALDGDANELHSTTVRRVRVRVNPNSSHRPPGRRRRPSGSGPSRGSAMACSMTPRRCFPL